MKNNSIQKNNFKNKFELLLNVSNDLIFILNSSGYFEVVNNNGSKKLGYEESDIVGIHFTDIIAPSDSTIVSESIKDLLKRRNCFILRQYCIF